MLSLWNSHCQLLTLEFILEIMKRWGLLLPAGIGCNLSDQGKKWCWQNKRHFYPVQMDQQKVVCFWFFFFHASFFIPADVSFVLGGRGAAEGLGMQRAGGISWAQDAQELSSGRRISRGSVITPCPLWGWEFQGLVPFGSGEHREEMPERNVNCALHLPQSSWDWDELSKPYEIKMSQPVMCHEGKRNHNLKKKILGSTWREPPRNMERVYLKGEEWEKCFVIKCKEDICGKQCIYSMCFSVSAIQFWAVYLLGGCGLVQTWFYAVFYDSKFQNHAGWGQLR